MFSPVLAAPNEPVLCASTDRAVPYLFLYFFHIWIYNYTGNILRLRSERLYPCLYDSTKEAIKRFGK
jgi:hypothetical protein